MLGDSQLEVTPAALELAGMPPELPLRRFAHGGYNFDYPTAIISYIQQLRKSGTGRRRATIVVVGYEGAGKSSLVWRLRHPEGDLPHLASTDGIATGALLCCRWLPLAAAGVRGWLLVFAKHTRADVHTSWLLSHTCLVRYRCICSSLRLLCAPVIDWEQIRGSCRLHPAAMVALALAPVLAVALALVLVLVLAQAQAQAQALPLVLRLMPTPHLAV